MNKVKFIAAKCKNHVHQVAGALTGAAVGVMSTVSAFAAEEGATGATGISINFEPTQMFTYSNVIIDCLMPVVYITAGLSLGFTVIYALRGAFSTRM